ncbi:MAG: DUF503 domain-containing protein [Actinomycetota bacterium]|jgi:hypothetical protein|nr:DUF503 domain-containing protein [Actinomycetota bacterium]
MHVCTVEMELHIGESTSLKAKRAVIKHLVESARHRFGVSAAEVGFQDQWQRSIIGFAAVAGTAGHAEELVERAERYVWSHPEVAVLRAERRWVELD